MDSKPQLPAAMKAFNDPEIRISIMERSNPDTLWAIISGSPDAFRTFKAYPKTLLNASIASMNPSEAQKAKWLVKAMVANPVDLLCVEGLEAPGDRARSLDQYFYECRYRNEPFSDTIADPVGMIKKLGQIGTAVEILESARSRSAFPEEEVETDALHWKFTQFLLALRENDYLKDSLWYLALYCELFFSSAEKGGPEDGSVTQLRRNQAHLDYMLFIMNNGSVDNILALSFVSIYFNLFSLLWNVYEQELVQDFERAYRSGIENGRLLHVSGHGGFEGQLKSDVIADFQSRLAYQILLGLPFLASMYQRQANGRENRLYPKPLSYSDAALARVRNFKLNRFWRCPQIEAFELVPLSEGRKGYKLSIAFIDGDVRPLRRVDFDNAVFTDGFQPLYLGTKAVERAQRRWARPVYEAFRLRNGDRNNPPWSSHEPI